MTQVIGIIPARYGSERLPAKPLAEICGLPMVVRVYKNMQLAKTLNHLFVATDDQRIAAVCQQFDCKFIMTSPELTSGTARVSAAYHNLLGNKIVEKSDNIIINIQGDEPLLLAADIDKLVAEFVPTSFDVGTLVTKIRASEDFSDRNVVKVVLDKNDCALYFSRSEIPHSIEPYSHHCAPEQQEQVPEGWKHIGIYAYREQALAKFMELPPNELERREKLEQLRLLADGAKFYCAKTENELISVDTAEDLAAVVKKVKVGGIRQA